MTYELNEWIMQYHCNLIRMCKEKIKYYLLFANEVVTYFAKGI